ncbi:hypothetical protein [Insolitispirillum peregrinum]|uniref:hypothetical protein n=1 Tax=Insolitispirillum peregrinum TaxID=80876 RepID=UPI0011154F9C|nr:hypothetical protein [Insolitispirillum peregrinum]
MARTGGSSGKGRFKDLHLSNFKGRFLCIFSNVKGLIMITVKKVYEYHYDGGKSYVKDIADGRVWEIDPECIDLIKRELKLQSNGNVRFTSFDRIINLDDVIRSIPEYFV